MDSEKRHFARLALHAKASIRHGYERFEAELEDVSMSGAFVALTGTIGLHDLVAFTIDLTGTRVTAKVIRVTENGMALRFENTLFS